MAGYVLEAGLAHPSKIALEVVGAQRTRLSYGSLRAAVLGVATGLSGKGLAPGARILLRLGNTPDFPIAYLGALAAGMIPVPTSAALMEPEVARILAGLKPDLVLNDPSVACPQGAPDCTLEDLRAMYALRPAPLHLGSAERPGYVIYTSGTSGTPRAVLHAHRAILARRMMFDGWYGLRPDDRVMHAGAFNWTYTLGTGLMDPWTIGATALIPAPDTPAQDLPDLLAEHEATIFAAAPGIYRRLLRQVIPPMPRLRHGLSAGEKLPEITRVIWQEKTGTPIFEAYGMSECSTFISGSPAAPAAPGTLGQAQAGRSVALVGPSGPVPAGTEGVIAVHKSDPGLMLGYLDAPDETAARFQGDGFLPGDQGEGIRQI